MISIY